MIKILYIGGFELPDKNAAAQRVLSIAKALRKAGFEIFFYGNTRCCDYEGVVDGFEYQAQCYPEGVKSWVKYAIGTDIVKVIEKYSPNIIIAYNYPAIAQYKVIKYCRKRDIKFVADVTEWYSSRNFMKSIDTSLRMKWCNKKLDGLILISSYLYKYYHTTKVKCLQLPPMTDISESKWQKKEFCKETGKIKLIYVGNPGKKDRLDYILDAIRFVSYDRFYISIVGMTAEQFVSTYGKPIPHEIHVDFLGKIPHKEAIGLLMKSDFQVFFRDNIRANNAGFPTKYVESVTAGIPVIMNKISNVTDYLKNGVNGFVVDNLSLSDIEKVFTQVSNLSRKQINEMKHNCNCTLFDFHNFVEVLADFIKTV